MVESQSNIENAFRDLIMDWTEYDQNLKGIKVRIFRKMSFIVSLLPKMNSKLST